MSTTYAELYNQACALAEGSNDESSRRAAISRLYYSAFHACHAFHKNLLTPGSVGNANGRHMQLIAMLDNPTIERNNLYWLSKGLSKSLRAAMVNRVNSDYLIEQDITPEELTESVTQCRIIMEKTN